jgi:hypothetical protein
MNDQPVPIRVLTAGGAGVAAKAASKKAYQDEAETKPLVNLDQVSSGVVAVHDAENRPPPPSSGQNASGHLEYEEHDDEDDDGDIEDVALIDDNDQTITRNAPYSDTPQSIKNDLAASKSLPPIPTPAFSSDIVWLAICFFGIMASFVFYGLLLEYTTSGGRKLHELSFLFVTSALYTVTAAAGRYVRDETPTTIPPARFAILGLTSMASTWCSIRSLRYVCAVTRNENDCRSVSVGGSPACTDWRNAQSILTLSCSFQ